MIKRLLDAVVFGFGARAGSELFEEAAKKVTETDEERRAAELEAKALAEKEQKRQEKEQKRRAEEAKKAAKKRDAEIDAELKELKKKLSKN